MREADPAIARPRADVPVHYIGPAAGAWTGDEGEVRPLADPRRDLGHAVVMGVSTGINALLGFASGILLVQGLSVQQFGLASAAMSAVLVAQEFVGRGINEGVVRLAVPGVAGSTERASEVYRAGLVLKLLLGAIWALAAWLLWANPRLAGWLLGTPEITPALPAMAASVVGFGLWTLVLTRPQAHLRFQRLALLQPVANALKVALLLCAIALGALTWTGAVWITAGSLLLGAAVMGAYGWRDTIALPWNPRRLAATVGEVWRLARWSIVAAVAYVASGRMDVFTLTRLRDATEVGLYNAAWQILVIMDLAMMTIMAVMIPKAAACTQREELDAWARRTVKLAAAAAIPTLGLFLFADAYVPLLFGARYAPSVPLLRIMYPGSLASLLVLPLVGILHARKAFHVAAGIHLAVLAASIPVYRVAVERAGLVGAANATLGLRLANCALLGAAAFVAVRGASPGSAAGTRGGGKAK
jgi:O-antigen/teichoic acid export membrane protein